MQNKMIYCETIIYYYVYVSIQKTEGRRLSVFFPADAASLQSLQRQYSTQTLEGNQEIGEYQVITKSDMIPCKTLMRWQRKSISQFLK